jgi:hypothetical protein
MGDDDGFGCSLDTGGGADGCVGGIKKLVVVDAVVPGDTKRKKDMFLL